MRLTALAAFVAALALARPANACTNGWKLVGTRTFRAHDALMRSQGVTTTSATSTTTTG
jgi:hypothetical protein